MSFYEYYYLFPLANHTGGTRYFNMTVGEGEIDVQIGINSIDSTDFFLYSVIQENGTWILDEITSTYSPGEAESIVVYVDNLDSNYIAEYQGSHEFSDYRPNIVNGVNYLTKVTDTASNTIYSWYEINPINKTVFDLGPEQNERIDKSLRP